MNIKENIATNSFLNIVTELPCILQSYLPNTVIDYTVYQSTGLIKHIEKRHPDCLSYLDCITDIINHPDYIGTNPNETVPSLEFVKKLDDNILVGIKLDIKDNYLYIATLHTITTSKLEHRVASGRLKAVDNL